MAGVTLKVLQGADRGKVFSSLMPPFTVGREEVNDIQLNDERISRCHFKVQRDNDRLVLTDLDSTNGTKVNGVEYPLKILRSGDLIGVGRSLMLVGTEEEIAARLVALSNDGNGAAAARRCSSARHSSDPGWLDPRTARTVLRGSGLLAKPSLQADRFGQDRREQSDRHAKVQRVATSLEGPVTLKRNASQRRRPRQPRISDTGLAF